VARGVDEKRIREITEQVIARLARGQNAPEGKNR
jgi:hypothetical protein